MKREKTVFKVLLRERGQLVSAVQRRHKLTYIPNKWTKPVIGKIFAFEDDSTALTYMQELWDYLFTYELWRCIGMNPVNIKRICHSEGELYQIVRFWKGDFVLTCPPPPGTVVVDKLKLLEKQEGRYDRKLLYN